jgi:hypothetical protein
MALTLEKQLASSFNPSFEMALTDCLNARSGNQESVSGTIIVSNKGNLPLKIRSVSMMLVYDKSAFPMQEQTWDAKNRVVAPGQTTQFPLLMIEVPLGTSTTPYDQIAQIECSDLAGVSKNSFSVSSRNTDQHARL